MIFSHPFFFADRRCNQYVQKRAVLSRHKTDFFQPNPLFSRNRKAG